MNHSSGAAVPEALPPSGFEATWGLAQSVPGWLKKGQARMLFEEARRLPEGARVVEIGSHQGRSTIILAAAVKPRGGRVTAIDPFVEGRLFGGQQTRRSFEENVTVAGVRDAVDLVIDYSTRLRPAWSETFDLLYIDGKHDYWTLSDDLRWAQHLPEDASVLVHDSFSSIGVTLGLLAHVLPSRTLAYESRSDSMALLRRRRVVLRDRARLLAQLPWWIRNVGIKVLLRLRLRPLARAVGHDSAYDPY
ncbi:MAG: class I SAM-dependent methyltransferase [Nocardioides sp.]